MLTQRYFVLLSTGTKVKRLLAAGSEIPEGGSSGSSAEPSASTACTVELETDDGVSVLPAELVLWTAGASPATKAQRNGFPFPITERGAVVTVGGPSMTCHVFWLVGRQCIV